MGWVLMSERDVRRSEALTEVLSGRRTIASAAVVLAITARQVNRLLIRFREDGGGGLIHKSRSRHSDDHLDLELTSRHKERLHADRRDARRAAAERVPKSREHLSEALGRRIHHVDPDHDDIVC